jgi:hypothetical protein
MLTCFVLIRQLYLFIGSRIANNPYVVGFGYPVGWMTCCVLELSYYLTRIRGRKNENTVTIVSTKTPGDTL